MKRGFEILVLLLCALAGAFYPAAAAAVLSGFVSLKQQRLDVILGVPPAILMQYAGTLGQTHGCQPIILGDDDITGLHPVCKSKVHAVRAFVKNEGLRPVPIHGVGGIAKQKAGDLMLAA